MKRSICVKERRWTEWQSIHRCILSLDEPFASQSTQYLLSSSRSICVSRFWHFSCICLARSFSWRDVIFVGSVFVKLQTTRDHDSPVLPPRDNAGQKRDAIPRNGFRSSVKIPLASAAVWSDQRKDKCIGDEQPWITSFFTVIKREMIRMYWQITDRFSRLIPKIIVI